jgi:hypothetical protein
MKRLRFTLGWSVGLFALTSSAALHAQGTASEKASAEALFDEGVSLVAAGNYSDGCTKFEASQAMEQTLGTELHLADCYERVGKTASAWALFKEGERLAHRQNESSREELARVRAAALAPKLSYLVIDVGGESPAGLVVERNRQVVPLASLGVALPVDPGVQELTARAPSRRTWSTRVDVRSAPGTVVVNVPRLAVIAAKPVAPAPRPLSHDESGGAQRAVGITATAVGFAGILAGVGLGLYAKRENDQSRLDRYCPTDGHNGCTSDGVRLRTRAEQFANVSTVTLVAGGTLLAGGILLWSTTPSSAERQPAAQVRVSATASRDSFQTVVGGSW